MGKDGIALSAADPNRLRERGDGAWSSFRHVAIEDLLMQEAKLPLVLVPLTVTYVDPSATNVI